MSKETIVITGSPSKVGGHDEETCASESQKLAEHLIALGRTTLDKWVKGDTSGYRDLWSKCAFSYFDGVKDNRVDTYAEISATLGPMEGVLHADSYPTTSAVRASSSAATWPSLPTNLTPTPLSAASPSTCATTASKCSRINRTAGTSSIPHGASSSRC